MNKTSKRSSARGRRYPPAPTLTGRTGARRILGVSKRRFRQMESHGIVKAVPTEGQLEGEPPHWFELEAIRRVAAALHLAAKPPSRPARERFGRPVGVQRVTGAEARQIYTWFEEGRTHSEIVKLSDKTPETIRYLHAQWSTPNGSPVRSGAAAADTPATQTTDYYPERDTGPRPKPARAAMRRPSEAPGPAEAPKPAPTPLPAPRAATARLATVRPVMPVPAGQRSVQVVPASWFADLQDDDKDDDGG